MGLQTTAELQTKSSISLLVETPTENLQVSKEFVYVPRQGGEPLTLYVDPEGIGYREVEVKEAIRLFKTTRILFIRTNEGYGVSDFFIPRLNEQLTSNDQDNSVEVVDLQTWGWHPDEDMERLITI